MTYLIKKVKNDELQLLSFVKKKIQGLKRRCSDAGREAYIFYKKVCEVVSNLRIK